MIGKQLLIASVTNLAVLILIIMGMASSLALIVIGVPVSLTMIFGNHVFVFSCIAVSLFYHDLLMRKGKK